MNKLVLVSIIVVFLIKHFKLIHIFKKNKNKTNQEKKHVDTSISNLTICKEHETLNCLIKYQTIKITVTMYLIIAYSNVLWDIYVCKIMLHVYNEDIMCIVTGYNT